MEIPFDIIVNTEFTNAAPGSGLASFFLSRPPTFYLQHPNQNSESVLHWRKCADWTEDQQATKVLRHNLVGSAVQLTHVLRHLNAHTSGSDIRLHSPNYRSQELSPPVPEIQPPPIAAFARSGHLYHPHNGVDLRHSDHLVLTHKRSFSPVPSQQLAVLDESSPLPSERSLSGVIPEPDPPMYSQYSRPPAVEVDQSISYSNHSETGLLHHTSLSANCGSSRTFSPHGSHQRTYSASSVHSLPYKNDNRMLSVPDRLRPLASDGPSSFETPSPPLLTTPFYPAGSVLDAYTANPYGSAIPVMSGMPGMSILDTNC